jgi:hypothetical protein
MIFVICLLIIDGIYRRYLPSTHAGIEHSSYVYAIYAVLVTGIIGRVVIFKPSAYASTPLSDDR